MNDKLAEVRAAAWKTSHNFYLQEKALLKEEMEKTKALVNSDKAPKDMMESWSKCTFCGAYNGMYGRQLEQHTTRCLYRGDANTYSVMTPNHSAMILQDDQTFLPMMHAQQNLKQALKRIDELEALLRKDK